MKKRILTLALALAAVAALAVTAMAADTYTWTPGDAWEGGTTGHEHTAGTEHTVTLAPTCTATGTGTVTCTTEGCGAKRTDTAAALGHDFDTAWTTDGTKHWHACKRCTEKDSEGYCAADTSAWVKENGYHWHACIQDGCTTKFHNTRCSSTGEWVTSDADKHWKTCDECGEKVEEANHNFTFSAGTGENTHKKTCSCGAVKVAEHTIELEWANDATHHYQRCKGAGCDYTVNKEAHTAEWTKDENGHSGVCTNTNCNKTLESAPHTFNATTGKCDICAYANQRPAVGILSLSSSNTAPMNAGTTRALSFTAYDENDKTTCSKAGITYTSSNTAVATVSATGIITAHSAGQALISIKINGTTAQSFTLTVKNVTNLSVSVSQSIGVFSFGSDDTNSGYSIYDLIVSHLSPAPTATINNYTISLSGYNTSANNTVGTLSGYSASTKVANLGNVYLSIANPGTWSASYVIKSGSTEIMSGTLSIVVEAYTGADIIYSATLGEAVELDMDDFDDFWYEVVGNYYGSVTYVRFNSITGLNGTLCYEHVSNETRHTNAVGNSFYVNPARNQKYLDDLTFVPTKSGTKYTTGTATINFTVYGTNRNNSTTSANGSIVITYTNGEVQPIVYDSVSGVVYFDASDFNAVYKTATNSTSSNPSYTIKFLDVPTYGTLYRAYKLNSHGNNTGTALTERNIDNYTFSNRTTGENSITNVAYVPLSSSAVGDSVRYAVYSGNTLLYIGTVTFNSEKVVVSYTSTSSGVRFNAYDFYNTSSAILSAQYLSFGTPSSGTLYKNYNGTSGAVVTKNEYFGLTTEYGVTSLNSITYVPRANYTGVVEIPFTASSLTGVTFSGTVKVYVVAKPFADVNPSAWSAPYINRLYASGVVGGTSATTFSPKANMKYGEALKMILLAAGYPKQAETGGNHWATNYLTLAYRNGIVSSTNIDLNSLVDRNTIAEITAKALGLSKATRVDAGIIGPSDSSNGYVLALYNAGIVGGEFHGNTNYFYGSRNITREEVAKIICTVMDYKAK